MKTGRITMVVEEIPGDATHYTFWGTNLKWCKVMPDGVVKYWHGYGVEEEEWLEIPEQKDVLKMIEEV